MAIVPDLSGNSPIGGAIDARFSSPNRTVTQDPNGAVLPNYVGEIVVDTVNERTYRSRGAANTDWIVGQDTPNG